MHEVNIQGSDLVLLAHAGFGVAGCLAALWVMIEASHATAENAARMQTAAMITAVCMAAAWVFGGYWYVNFYPADKALILKGPWPFAHDLFMETKEHLFFATGLLALLLPIVAREKLSVNGAARKLAVTVAALILVTGLAVEGAGAVISHGVKVALLKANPKGDTKK
jgi:hypothetical protein